MIPMWGQNDTLADFLRFSLESQDSWKSPTTPIKSQRGVMSLFFVVVTVHCTRVNKHLVRVNCLFESLESFFWMVKQNYSLKESVKSFKRVSLSSQSVKTALKLHFNSPESSTSL